MLRSYVKRSEDRYYIFSFMFRCRVFELELELETQAAKELVKGVNCYLMFYGLWPDFVNSTPTVRSLLQ